MSILDGEFKHGCLCDHSDLMAGIVTEFVVYWVYPVPGRDPFISPLMRVSLKASVGSKWSQYEVLGYKSERCKQRKHALDLGNGVGQGARRLL